MPDIKNNIKVIYNALSKEGYNDLGSEQEFAESMADENNRKLVYNTLKGKEFADVKDYDSFSNMVYQQPRAGQQQEEEMKPVEPAKIDPRFVAPNVGKPTDAQPIMKSVQQDTGFAAPQDYNSKNAFLSNIDKDYNVASHIPNAQQPIKMYGADSNLGEVIDNLYTVYDEAYKKDNPKKIAEAANMARSMGLDNEQAEKALTLVHGLYSQNVANNIADYMYSRMNNGDPLYALKEVYYDKDFQKKLKDTTTRLGLDNTQGFVEYYLKPALQRKLENERGFTDTVNFGVQSGSDDIAKNTEVFEKRKAEEDLLQKQVDAMNAEGKRIEEKGQQMYDPNYKNRPWWADLIPVEGGGRSAYDEAEGIKRNPEAEELMRTGQAMQRMSDDAQAAISEDNILRTRKTDGLTNQIKNAFGRILRGGVKTATDIRTWDFGFTDLKDATVIKTAADAYANNRATAAQKALLNAVALKNAVMGKHGDALGGLYGAAGTTIQMAPFMMQFAASPVKGVGVGFQKYCRTQLEKAFGKYATEAVGKFVIKSGELAGRFVGDVAQGAAMTTIFNMPAVAADTHKRMTGDLEAATDSKGNIVYSGKRTNVKSGGRAFAEAFTAQTIENQSELVGEYFAPLQDFIQKGAIKALDKWGLARTKDFLTGINNKQLMKGFNRFTKKTEWNKLLGETGEEFIGNIENAATVGDLNFKLDPDDDNSVFSKKVNTDIILGVGLGCGIISGARVGSYIRNNRKLNTAIKDADSYADVIFGTDRWQQIKSEIDNAPDDKAGNLLQSYIDSEKLNKEQKQTIVDYTVNTYIKRGNDISHLKNAIEDNISSEQQEVQSAYENGQNAREAQMNEVKTSLDEAEKNAAELLGEDELNALDGVEDVDAFKESNAYKSYSEEQREAALKYIIARTAYNGMINRVQDEIKAAVNKANAEIDNLTHKDSGTIIRAALKNGDQEVYVVSGNVATSPDGKSIDTEKSDNDIVVYNTESGKKEMLNIKDLQSVDTPIDAATYKANNAEETTQQIAETEAAKIDGVRNFHYNDTVKVQDKEGNLIDGSVQDVTPDGIIVVSDAYPGGKTYTAEELTAMQPQQQQQTESAVNESSANEAPAQKESEANSPQSEATPQQEVVEPQQEAIPTDEKGNLLYHEVPVERTIEDLYDGSLDNTEIADFISANIKAAQKEYNSVVKKVPEIGTNKAKYLQEKQAYQEEVAKAKAKVDYWQAVENERQRITHTSPEELKNEEDELSGEAARKEYRGITTGDEENPTSVEDLVRDFLRGAKITPEDFRKETGLSISEQKKFVGMLSKQGKTIARLSEELADYDEWNLGGRFFGGDNNAARGAIIDVLLSSRTRGDFKQQDATAEEERYIEAVEQQREQWYYENYHMTYEEYLQYREIILPELLRKYANFAPDVLYPQFVASFEDAYAAEHSQTNNTENNEQQRNDTTAEEPTTTPGNTVLQTEETNNSRGDSQSEEQPTEVPTGVRSSNENGTLPQSTPTEVESETDYTLSDKKAENGENFYQDANGNIDLANIPEEVFDKIGKPKAPLRLTPSMLKHVFDRHGKEMGLSRTDDAIDFILDVMDNFDHVRQGDKNAVIFSIENGRSRTGRRAVTILLNSESGEYYGIKTSGYERIEGLNKKPLLWEKGANETSATGAAPANVTTEQAQQDSEPTGSASNHSNDSIGKVTQSSQTKETKEDKFSPTPRKDGESITDYAERVAEEHQAQRTRKEEEAKVDTNPTEAQKEAGNYKKGHIKVDGLDITIEQPKGSIRRGTDANGKQWESEMHNTYGYIRGTESVDGDHIDIFLSDNPTEGKVFVVDQVNKDGSFDEHKVMYGFPDMESARQAYLSNYEEGWQGLGNITEVSKEDFKAWIDSSKRKTKPFAEYTSVKTQGDMQTKKPTEAEDFARQDLKELEDFQKNTDTIGRTAIDENRYDAEDLFAALKLDGKSSKLGILTVVPDKITDPVVQIAVYDYSDEIDDKTNSGWQKWGDLADEYNKTVDKDDKAQERGDTATLSFRTVDAAVKFNDWLNTDGQKKHQTKKSKKESKDNNVFLSQKEYIEKELKTVLKQTRYKTLEEWESKDVGDYSQKYDDILETYEDYVRDLADDERLQAIYDKSSVKVQKEIREHLTDADLDYHEFINTSPKRIRIQDRLIRKSKYAKGEFPDGTIVSGEVIRWSPTSLTVNSRGTLYTINANKVLQQSDKPMNADEHEYQRDASLQYSGETLTNETEAKQKATETILTALNKAGIEVIQATDEQAQEMLGSSKAEPLKTPQGTVYGWTVNGKIYLTKSGLNPETPVHEYTHLWAEAMMGKNKQGWNSIKTLLKDTPVWNEVINDSNYSNIKDNEDAVASEVLSRISGRKNAAKMEAEAQKAIDKANGVFEKAEATTVLLKLKKALKQFWHWVGKNVFGIKDFKNIEEVTDRVLYDLLSNTKNNQKLPDAVTYDDKGNVIPLSKRFNKAKSDPRFQITDSALSDEEKKIVETAKANDTYMKAPNGKPTNLSEKQWAQVRTKAFKDWFGDWEKAARIEKLRRSKAVKITGEEIEPNSDLKQYKKNALEYGKNLRGEYTNKDTGETIALTGGNSRGGMREILQHDYKDIEHLQSIAAIPQIIEKAIFVDEAPNEDAERYPGVKSFRYYVCGLKIGNTNYTVKAVVAVQNNGDRYYDHKLSSIEKGKLLSIIPTIQKAGIESNLPPSVGKDKRLLSILQTNSSKVVDENGEPMVVYHGSNNEFTKFDTARIGSSTGTSDGRGFYFTTDKDYAYSFGKGGNVLSVFLNIDNPLSLKEKTITKQQLFDIIKRIDEKEVAADGEHWLISNYANYYDVGIEGAIREAAESEYPYSDNDVELVNSLISASGNFKDVVNSVYEITGKSSEIVPKENDTVHYVVTNPNQIKSATGNNGNFSTTEDDILYRTVFGGNSGYVGYSMSKRAAEAKEEGRYPKTEFRREYHITAKSLDMLTSLGFINNSEWHHTSMYGNKTPFYGWTEDELADDYLKHKKEVDTLCKGIDPKTKQPLIEKVEKPQYEHEYEMPQYGEAETAANSIREWRHKQIEKYDQFTGFKGYAEATEEEKKERDAYLHSLNEQMKEKIREMLAKDYPDYLAAKNALDAYNNYEEDLRKAIGERIKEYLDIDKYSQRWREQTATTQPTVNTEALTNHAESVVQNLHLNNVEIVADGSSLNGEQATAKGFYDKRTGKIVVVASNHTDIADIEKTVLHEAVAHHGLRELFGDNFDNFLDTVFAKADIETRRQIAHLSAKHGWNVRTATEEYLASMAEDTNFKQIKPTLWQRIKQLFGEIMSAFGLHHANITDNDLRYILWRSYKNLQNSGKHSILDKAEDIAMQYRLKAGNYANKFTNELNAVNERFNEELSNLTEENADKVTLWLGKPSKVLLAAGVEDKPMKLYGNKVIRKMKKHGFSLEELRDLPRAVADPVAVFNNYQREGNRSILTELKTQQGNFLVSVNIGKDADINFNIVRSVFGKGNENVVAWINNGLATYINKEKALSFLSHQSAPIAATAANAGQESSSYLHLSAPIAEAAENSELSSAAKIIKDFHNPKLNSNVLYRSSIDPTATEVLPDARTRYEEETKEPDNIGSVPKTHNFFRRFYKSYVDSMLALKSFTNSVLEATGDKMASHEDTYKAENAMTSKNKTDGEVYNRDYYNPLLTAAQQLCEAVGMDYDALNMYMVAKHGLERNEYMGKRAAQNDENVLKAKKALEDALVAYNEDPTSKNEAAVQKAQEKYTKVYDKALEVHTSRDYSGLTELTGKEDVAEAEYEAQKIVDAVETPDAMPKVTAFWSKVNAATKQTLKTGYESGIMTKDTYEHILNMYKYYIPLRGWAEPIADDVYTYYNNRSYEGKPLTKTAKGRTSLAEDPMAIIASMAQRSIIEANRNKMKQTFLNFVLNHPTSLATVGEQWYIKNALGEWERSDANIPANATPDEISKIIEEHELEMQALAETGEAIKQRNGLKLDKRVINGEGAEHTIKIWRGGKEYIIYINGNPAVAQAVNGLTNPDTQGSDLPKWAKIGAAQLKNFLSGVYTSFSPAFVLTNFTRDQLFASQAVYIKYGLKYKRQASKNARNLFFSGALPRLVYKWEHGTLDLNNETERYFDEFMRGGGETGFTALRDIESIKKEVKDAINGNKVNIAKRGWKSFINAVEFANRSAEDFSRFVTFMTSRQQGKNIVDSIYDAKDITVNFNKKGSGEMGSRFMNFAYIFFNAAVQSINNFGTMLKQHPARTMLIISKFGALGFGVPMLNAFLTALCGGGDDDKYWDNMDWVRRNNIVLRIPFLEKTFISIPLPQELRPFYGMGEIAASILFGKETFSSGLQKAVEGFTGLLPIDFTGNGGNLSITLTPTVLQPVAQYMFNTDYFGRKVYNDNENKKIAPGWTKAFSSTPPVLIEATKFLNSLTGGNDVDRGGVNLNPDVINHFVKGYFGGPATFVTQMSSLLYKGFKGNAKEIRWRDVPVASRFVQQLDERSVRSSAQGSYKDFKEETEETEYRLSNYKKQVKMGKMEYAKMITDLIKSPEYQRYKIAKAYKKPMDLLQETLSHIDNTTDKKEVEKALTGLRHYMMETVESEQKGKHAKREEDFNYLGDNLSELNNNLKSSLRSLKRNEEQRLDGEEDDGIEELISEDKETTMRIIREMNKLFKKK